MHLLLELVVVAILGVAAFALIVVLGIWVEEWWHKRQGKRPPGG